MPDVTCTVQILLVRNARRETVQKRTLAKIEKQVKRRRTVRIKPLPPLGVRKRSDSRAMTTDQLRLL
jgi:hypothetical protein